MIARIGDFFIRFRHVVLALIIILTGFFAYQASHVSMYSMFDDLLPPNHPYIKIHKQYKEVFGGANVVTVSIEVKQGDIFNTATLSKIKSLTETIELTEGANNYQIFSIARPKVKDIRSTAWGVEMMPVMWPNVPQTRAELVDLKNIIHANDMIWGHLVSRDDKAALITAVFWEGKINYRYIFERFQSAKKSLEDGNTVIRFAGEPVLYGWIYHHLGAVAQIFCLTVLAILLVLVVSFRRMLGVVMPLISALVSAVWGVGLMGLLGYNFDPLILVVPFLISARTLSHSVQMTARYIEEYAISGDKVQAAKASFIGLLAPGSISIITDAAGLLVLLVAPIPMITKLAYVGCFWVMSNLVSVMVLNPVLLTYMPAPRRLSAEINGHPPKVDRFTAVMDKAGKLCYGKISSWVIVACAVLVAVFSFISLKDLTVGDARPGSPLLWPDSEYNLSVRDINKKFPGVDQLMVVVEGREADSVKTPEVLKTMEALEREILDLSTVGGAASLGSICKKMNALLHYDHPLWLRFPESRMDVGMLFELIQISTEPGDFDKWVNYNFKDSNIIVYLKDHRGNTIREVIQTIKAFIAQHPLKEAQFKLAGGYIGMLAAANEVIWTSNEWNLFLILSFTFICCALAYSSIVAGLLFIVSLCLANFFTLAVMARMQIGLDINTLPVISLGIGLGVDYGLYIVSRVKEDFLIYRDLKVAIPSALSSTGKAVVITAVTMTVGIIFWYFSPLRFQAEMGLLLTIVLLMNLIGGVLLLPTLLYLIKPKFMKRI